MNKNISKMSVAFVVGVSSIKTFTFTELNRDIKVNNKIYNKTCATSENSDAFAQSDHSLRDRMCLLKLLGCPKRNKREPLTYWVGVQTDLSLYWFQRSYGRFCHALTHFVRKQNWFLTHIALILSESGLLTTKLYLYSLYFWVDSFNGNEYPFKDHNSVMVIVTSFLI